MDVYCCLCCQSFDVRRSDSAFADVTLIALACENCQLEEERRSDAADLTLWLDRWRGRPQIPIYDFYDDLVDVD